ncbi:anhydro-N-acetylmuramic acid kinase [Bacteroidia bacterium]|nr:anhydro-N-acetylmuramic acid kinase [Bacteroidia bacterium]
MSGTSLDGLDLCLSQFEQKEGRWHYQILASETVPYNEHWRQALASAHWLQTIDFIDLHKRYGTFLGEQAAQFLVRHHATSHYIASHGHTIFHQPQRGITFQLGDGNTLAAAAHCSTLFDFRSLSVALGGQGAPLVPMGDALLFGDYDVCLNLGGFANVSFGNEQQQRIAFDVCPCNIVLNHLCQQLGAEYDQDGHWASQGTVDTSLLQQLNQLDFYAQKGSKSLGREWVENTVLNIINNCPSTIYDKLCTFCEHIAIQVSICAAHKRVLATGGGAHNTYLMQRIAHYCAAPLCKPSRELIDFKEALIFAFLGALYLNDKCNCMASATGGKDCIGGVLVKI